MASAREIARLLARRAPEIAAELLPNGRRDGAEWRVGSIRGEKGSSCAVHLSGDKAGVWKDFASGEAGDLLGLVAAVRFGGDVGAAMAWARHRLGIAATSPVVAPVAPDPAPPRLAPATDAGETRRLAAVRMFDAARPLRLSDPAARYLAGRSIDLGDLGALPRSLRFMEELWCREAQRHFPAMLAAVLDVSGRQVATHRTWLQKGADGVWRKAPLEHPKKSLGSLAGGSIRLWRGASGVPLADAPDGETVVIAEGIETGLSVAVACPELRVLSAVSLGNMASLVLPPAIGTVIIAADNDPVGNLPAVNALQRAVANFCAQGRNVKVAMPADHKDFNDVLAQADA